MLERLFIVTDQPISVEEVTKKVVRPEAGAVSSFIGTVREYTRGRRTLSLTYEAYRSMAEKQLEKIGEEISRQWPDAKTAITHRTGHLAISEIAVVIAVSTPHRKDAFWASEYAIERIKQIVPIWKKEHWEDGEQWIGNQLETEVYPEGKPKGVESHD
ncbi:molybdenum cofactor biosynthesis protein MoaE [Bacillus badius]|uniref:Molybdenum cofactor biosynthesis protein MoaE n=1 Tax=Bacillus badius TaxID=1455 RepID=A0ABR5AWC4_BACBA|nr:molybdenum cofactor biosynthesis protein MoaE [Bacillus badius]KIL79012.1 Molybdenum cofactor biosynthesis protein MoaE [Bacillus badius]MED4715552.1 molybdenum cofactor biosynthesis protein MoaE [Bacillus badius]